MEQTLTEGARRILRLATRLANQAGAKQREPLHLLWALLLEESQASEVLGTYGIAAVSIADSWPLNGSPAQYDTTADATADQPIDDDDDLQGVLFEAHRAVGQAGRHAAMGSEHLLFGLAAVDSPAAEILRRHGIDADALSPVVREKSGFSSEPIAVEEKIHFPDRTESVHTDALRIIDAAANRAREGLRVIEDFVRFRLDDAHLTGLLKSCRHRLSAMLRSLDRHRLVASRETQQDVGTEITTEAELLRADVWDVMHANFKRVQEAVRSLEEFGKVVAPTSAVEFGKLRYEIYTLEKAVAVTTHSQRRLAGRHLYLLLTEELCRRGSGPVVRDAVAAGVGMVQIREKNMPDAKLLTHARRVREWTRKAGALMIVNDRPDIAVLADADGVHVGQDELSVREVRRILGADRLVGVSTHSIEQARQAVLDGADYIGVGPVFQSSTKRFDELPGLELLRAVAAEISLPWFAIGGIRDENVGEVARTGATRIAVSGAICGADRPGEAASDLIEQLHPE